MAEEENRLCSFKKDNQFLLTVERDYSWVTPWAYVTNCIPQQNSLFVVCTHIHTHLHKHSKTWNRVWIQTSYLAYTDTQNRPGLCVVQWNPVKTSLFLFLSLFSLFLFHFLKFSCPLLDVATVVWGLKELNGTLLLSGQSNHGNWENDA